MKTLLAIIFLSALPTIAFAQNKNSIVFQDNGKPVPVADPCVYEDNGVYYLTGTTGTTDGKHGFDYYYSKDLRTWTYGGPLFRVGENHPGVDCFWAPEVRKYNGKFYMTYSCYIGDMYSRKRLSRQRIQGLIRSMVRAQIHSYRLRHLH